MHVRGVGKVPCEFMLIGSHPGWEEDRDGRAWVGKTGDELRRFFDGDDLPLFQDIYATNLYKQYKGRDYIYTEEDRLAGEPELVRELERVKPRIIIPLGVEATRWLLSDEIDLDDVQGIPWQREHDVVFPVTHPASAFHNSERANYVVSGFKELASYLAGDIEPRKLFDDPLAGREQYEEITTKAQLQSRLRGLPKGSTIALDSEGWSGKPWSVQFSTEAGSAYLIRAQNRETLLAFGDELRLQCQRGSRLIFHSALHDLGMMRAMGIPWNGPFEDTMIQAYLLQIEPQGLKAGCLRQCNMKMSDYMDIVGDSANELMRDYLTWIWDAEEIDHEEACAQEFHRLTTTPYQNAKGKWVSGRKLKVPPKLPRTPLHKAVQRVLQSKRPYSLWRDQVEDIQVAGYHRLGAPPEATLDHVDQATAVKYGCRDADGTTRLLPEYSRRIDAMGLRPVYELELSTYPLLDRMQQVGIKPDLEWFGGLSDVLNGEIVRLQSELSGSTRNPAFNANSGDQVAEYLFGTLGLEEIKLTSNGRGSTNDKILEALEHEHPEIPAISTIRSYRETYKLKNTFVDRLPDFVNRFPFDGRVHTTLRTTRVVTGRLAASDPNLLAQPEHGAFAKDFQRGWVAEEGHYVCAWDESQIELRGLAHLSQDPLMLAVFRGERRNPDGSLIDLHAALAERIFGVPPALQDKHKHRLPAKAINFGIPMGMTCKGLSVELRKNGVDADEDTAQRWLDETLGLYTGVKSYMQQRIAEAKRQGFVRCLSGRIRYIGGIRSRNDRTREEAERFAFSTPIQESAQYVMKQAEAKVWTSVLPYFWKKGHYVEPLLQVHDCLKMECAIGLERELHQHMTDAMVNVKHGFSVPLAIEGEYGPNFADTKRFS